MNKEREQECLDALQQKGTEAGAEFEELWRGHVKKVRKIAFGYAETQLEQDEIVSDVMEYLWTKLAIERREVTNAEGFFSNATKWRGLDYTNGKGSARNSREVLFSEMSLNAEGDMYEGDWDNSSPQDGFHGMDRGGWMEIGDGCYRGRLSISDLAGGIPILPRSYDPVHEMAEADEAHAAVMEIISNLPSERVAPLTALMMGDKQTEVAEAFGIPTTTINRWFRELKEQVSAHAAIGVKDD